MQVINANTTTQVAEWKHNRTTIPEQVRVFVEIIKHINESVEDQNSIYYSVENNTLGEAALISLAEYGEDNIPGIFLSETKKMGTGRRFRKGFNTTNKSKISACAKFKNLVESGKFKIKSRPLVSELKNFVAHGTSYAAKPGEHDDLVMATVLGVRMLQQLQEYHKNIGDNLRDYDDDIVEPLPFIMI